jgi:hypothetical protein
MVTRNGAGFRRGINFRCASELCLFLHSSQRCLNSKPCIAARFVRAARRFRPHEAARNPCGTLLPKPVATMKMQLPCSLNRLTTRPLALGQLRGVARPVLVAQVRPSRGILGTRIRCLLAPHA